MFGSSKNVDQIIAYFDKAIELSTYMPINENRLVKVFELREFKDLRG